MGNSLLKFLCGGGFSKPLPSGHDQSLILSPHGITPGSVDIFALAQDMLHYGITSQAHAWFSKVARNRSPVWRISKKHPDWDHLLVIMLATQTLMRRTIEHCFG